MSKATIGWEIIVVIVLGACGFIVVLYGIHKVKLKIFDCARTL
jgi:Trk-type K+ transport system membrane component